MKLLITIDGPAGAGKTTVSRLLSQRLGYRYIDTGALYRGVALGAKEENVPTDNEIEVGGFCEKADLSFVRGEHETRLLLNGEDVTDRIRTPEITMLASKVSAYPKVREYLLNLQREMAKERGVVFEGRDMGTVVFPDADVKFFLDASPDSRAVRRHKELGHISGQSLKEVQEDLKTRDKNDSTRKIAPLKPAYDAVIIDSTELSIDSVLDRMIKKIKKIEKI